MGAVFLIINHGSFYRPPLNHVHFNFITVFAYKHNDNIIDTIFTFRYN